VMAGYLLLRAWTGVEEPEHEEGVLHTHWYAKKPVGAGSVVPADRDAAAMDGAPEVYRSHVSESRHGAPGLEKKTVPLRQLLLLDIIHRGGRSLAEATADLKTFPQVIVNVKVREKRPLEEIASVAAAIAEAEAALAETWRVVIRYSGTEALARVMIEAESEEMMRRHAEAIAEAIRGEIGV